MAFGAGVPNLSSMERVNPLAPSLLLLLLFVVAAAVDSY